MVALIGNHRADHADFVRHGACVRQEVGELHPTVTIALKGARTGHDPRASLDDRIDQRKPGVIQEQVAHAG